mgnify:CR=1 FL=1
MLEIIYWIALIIIPLIVGLKINVVGLFVTFFVMIIVYNLIHRKDYKYKVRRY